MFWFIEDGCIGRIFITYFPNGDFKSCIYRIIRFIKWYFCKSEHLKLINCKIYVFLLNETFLYFHMKLGFCWSINWYLICVLPDVSPDNPGGLDVATSHGFLSWFVESLSTVRSHGQNEIRSGGCVWDITRGVFHEEFVI